MTPFKGNGGDSADARMAPSRVVPAFDVREERPPRLRFRSEAVAADELALERCKEALGHCVVVGVADAAHRCAHAHFLTPFTECDARVLAAAIAVMNDLPWPSLRHGHVQCREYEIRCHLLLDRPAHDAPTPHI